MAYSIFTCTQIKKLLDKIELDKLIAGIINSEVNLSSVLEKNLLLKHLTKVILERALQSEMTENLGYEKFGNNSNTRNYSSSKIFKDE
jgi:putative transposase